MTLTSSEAKNRSFTFVAYKFSYSMSLKPDENFNANHEYRLIFNGKLVRDDVVDGKAYTATLKLASADQPAFGHFDLSQQNPYLIFWVSHVSFDQILSLIRSDFVANFQIKVGEEDCRDFSADGLLVEILNVEAHFA